jgi:hypothetical protein
LSIAAQVSYSEATLSELVQWEDLRHARSDSRCSIGNVVRLTPIFITSIILCSAHVRAQTVDPIYSNGFDAVANSAPANWQGNLNVHNALRATVSPAANPALPAMTWNAGVASAAQAHANRCVWQHSGAAGLGENLYASTSAVNAETAAATSWKSEEADYNYVANSCASGRMCGHYTQMVWRSSIELGCGVQRCSTGSPFANSSQWTNVVCNYRLPGNYVGQRPY